MNILYNSAVSYQRMNSYIGSFILGILGVIFIFCGIFSLSSSFSKKNNTPSNTLNTPNTPSSSESTSDNWPMLFGLGIILSLLSWGLYFMATDTSKTTENTLATLGTFNALNGISGIFSNKRGGYFEIGE